MKNPKTVQEVTALCFKECLSLEATRSVIRVFIAAGSEAAVKAIKAAKEQGLTC